MENKKRGTSEEAVRKIVEPIFNKVLLEASKNLTEGRTTRRSWQPHNYRVFFQFSKNNFRPPLGSSINSDKEFLFKDFHGCRIIVHKRLVEVINLSLERQWITLQYSSVQEFRKFLDENVRKINEFCVSVLKKFVDEFGGKSNFEIVKVYAEHGFKGDEFLDALPSSLMINAKDYKKVYSDKFEFKNVPALTNFVENRFIENKAIIELEKIKKGLEDGVSDRELLVKTLRVLNKLIDEIERGELVYVV